MQRIRSGHFARLSRSGPYPEIQCIRFTLLPALLGLIHLEDHRPKQRGLCTSLKFPAEMRPDALKATLKNGILEAVLPKAEPIKKAKIDGRPL